VQGLQFHPDVFFEIKASYDWYQEKATGLGDDFLNELENGYQAIMEFPDTWSKFTKSFQRFILSKFPFSIIYRANNNTIFIIAVMHHSRKPGYWLKRT
jgi:plasmid stabilization system protein ParE